MKKFLFLLCAVALFASCKTMDTVNKKPVNCKYNLLGAQTDDFSLSDISLNVAMSITNLDASEIAKMNKFEGTLFINGNDVSPISFGSYEIYPGDTVIAKTSLNLPYNKIGKNIAGLVTMNSVAIKYKIVGKAYYETAEGEIPFPIVVEQQRKD